MLTVLFTGQVFLSFLGGAYCHIDIALCFYWANFKLSMSVNLDSCYIFIIYLSVILSLRQFIS